MEARRLGGTSLISCFGIPWSSWPSMWLFLGSLAIHQVIPIHQAILMLKSVFRECPFVPSFPFRSDKPWFYNQSEKNWFSISRSVSVFTFRSVRIRFRLLLCSSSITGTAFPVTGYSTNQKTSNKLFLQTLWFVRLTVFSYSQFSVLVFKALLKPKERMKNTTGVGPPKRIQGVIKNHDEAAEEALKVPIRLLMYLEGP